MDWSQRGSRVRPLYMYILSLHFENITFLIYLGLLVDFIVFQFVAYEALGFLMGNGVWEISDG